MRRAALFLALAALAGSVHAEISGLPGILAKPGLHYLVIGEMRGTEEIPAFFGDLVAEASARKPVSVVLEYPQSRQRDLNRFLASAGDAADRKALLSTDYWKNGRDGRTSRAMLALLDRLRLMKLPVIACQPDASAGDPGSYERVMGQCWKQAIEDREPGQLALILAGGAHASFLPVLGDYPPAVAELPREQTISLDTLVSPGWSWHCEKGKCGEYPSHAGNEGAARGIHLGEEIPVDLGTFDGAYSAGPHFTASPPAATGP